MDVWLAVDAKHKRSSPGYVRHYILDTSDAIGGEVGVDEMSRRLGHATSLDVGDIVRDAGHVRRRGAAVGPRALRAGRREVRRTSRRATSIPSAWVPFYPNPAFLRMTERDAAWMARMIARFTPDDVRKLVELGRWSRPGDASYLTNVLIERQRADPRALSVEAVAARRCPQRG